MAGVFDPWLKHKTHRFRLDLSGPLLIDGLLQRVLFLLLQLVVPSDVFGVSLENY